MHWQAERVYSLGENSTLRIHASYEDAYSLYEIMILNDDAGKK